MTQLSLYACEAACWREECARLKRRVNDQAERLDRQINGRLNREILRNISNELKRVAT